MGDWKNVGTNNIQRRILDLEQPDLVVLTV
jgi:hypothetical protein